MKRILSVILSIVIVASMVAFSVNTAMATTDETESTATTQSAIQAMRDSLTLTFHDEFDGTEIDKTKWGYEYDLNGGTRNGEPQLYTCDDRTKNAYVEDGKLVLEGRRVTEDEVWYNADGTKQEAQQDADGNYYVLGNDGKSKYYFTSASLRSYWARYPDEESDDWSLDHWTKVYNNAGIKYGMLEARIMFPEQSTQTDETWPAFWTTGGSANGPEGELDSSDKTKNWPTAGEIDIAELFSKQYNMNQLVHYSPNYDGNHSTALAGGYTGSPNNTANTVIRGTYHTYGIYYTDKFFMYYVDDVVCAAFDISSSQYDFFRKNPQFVFLNMAIGDMNSYGLGVNAAPNLVKAQLKVDYVRAYQATDGDYSHINILPATSDVTCSPSGSQNTWQPGTKALTFSNGVSSINVKTNKKIDEGKYDVFLTGTKAYWTTGAFDVAIDGSTYTANADYSQHSASAETGEWYCDDLSTYVGTADIQNGAHNVQVNLSRSKAPKDAIGCILRSLILVGKSNNDATVTIDKDDEVSTTTTTVTTNTTQSGETTSSSSTTTTTSGESEIVYDNFFMTYDPNTNGNHHVGNIGAPSFGSHAVQYDSSMKNNLFLANRSQLATNPGGSSDMKIIWDTHPAYDLTSGTYKLIAFVVPSSTSGTFSFTQFEDGNVSGTNGTLVGNVDFTNATPIASYDGGKAKAYEVGKFTIVNGDTDKTAFTFAPVSSGSKITLHGLAVVPVTPIAKMEAGAEIRLNSVNGIRFLTKFDASQIQKLQSEGATVELGTLIAPKDYLKNEDETYKDLTFELDENQYVDVQYKAKNDDGSFIWHKGIEGQIAGSLVTIKDTNISREFIGRGYVKVTKDENTTITYADYQSVDGGEPSMENHFRSLQYVAQKLQSDTEHSDIYEQFKERIDAWAKGEPAPKM